MVTDVDLDQFLTFPFLVRPIDAWTNEEMAGFEVMAGSYGLGE